MTLLAASFFADSMAELDLRAQEAWRLGAEAVELRIDTFDDDAAKLNHYLADNRNRTWIVTCRSAEEGGHFRGDTMERVSQLITAARGTGAFVDFELNDYLRSSNIAQKIQLAVESVDGHKRLILSHHDFAGVPEEPTRLVERCLAIPNVAACKIAFKASRLADAFIALDLMKQFPGRVVAIGMGESGLMTRVLARKLGAFAAYASLTDADATAPGQVSVENLIGRFRWRKITETTAVFGVLGDPVNQSMSPALMNHWFEQAGIDAVYLPMLVADGVDSLERVLDGFLAKPWLHAGGFSVTKPHKTAALRWLGSRADRTAELIGAVNTIVCRNGDATGFNTDSYAALDSLVSAMGIPRRELADRSVDVLGTGGAARALLSALSEIGCRITIFGRNESTTAELAEYFHATAAPWDARSNRRGQVLVNCTNIGMSPAIAESPMPDGTLAGCDLVFDMTYNPQKTRLLQQAEAMGIRTLNGLDMFLKQAATQFELWTGVRPDEKSGRELVMSLLR